MSANDVIRDALAGPPEEPYIRVAGSSSAKEVSVAIGNALLQGEQPLLRAIGAGAVNQAVKAVIIASAYAAQRGLTLVMRPGWEHISVAARRPGQGLEQDHPQEVSAMVLRVISTPNL